MNTRPHLAGGKQLRPVSPIFDPRWIGRGRAVILCTAAVTAGLSIVREGHIAPGLALAAGGAAYVLLTALSPHVRRYDAEHHSALTAGDMMLITAVIWLTGGLQSEYYLLYYIPVMSAGLRLDGRDGIAASVLAFVFYSLVAVAADPGPPAAPVGPLRVAGLGMSVLVLVLVFALLRREVTLCEDLRETLHSSLKRVAAVYDLAHAANTRSDLADVLSILLAHAARATRAANGTIYLLGDDRELLPMVWLPADLEHGAESLPISRESALQALDTGAPVAATEGPTAGPGGADERTVVCVPLVTPGGTAGVLLLVSQAGRRFSRRQVEFLTTLCSEAALTVENARLRSELGRLAVTDHLTGLANRRAVEDCLETTLEATAAEHQTLSLLIVDVDNLKAVNDRYGHAAGDEVLRALARMLACAAAPPSGKRSGRLGGDEFMVVLPGTNSVRAKEFADELVQRFPEMLNAWPTLPAPGEVAHLAGISIGVAATDEDRPPAKEIMARADDALYEAKRRGKSRSCVAPPSLQSSAVPAGRPSPLSQ